MSLLPFVRRARGVRAVRRACVPVLETLETRQLLTMLFFENFDFVNFQNSREEGPQSGQGVEGENVWTNVPPTGWAKDDTGVPGYNNPDLPWDPNADPPIAAGQEDNNGITEWIGWTFPKKDWWATTAGDQRRTEFTNASGGIMVADNDEWDDAPHPGKGSWLENELYNAKITSPSISLNNSSGPLTLDFDSSWRPEGFDDNAEGATPVNNQTGIINVVFSDGSTREIMHWDSDPTGPFFHDHLPNEHVTLPIGDVPAGATSFKLEFLETKSANDWWWAVDNVAVQGNKTFPGAKLIGVTGNQGGETAETDETLWNIGYVGAPTTNPAYLDGWTAINNPPAPTTTAYATGQFGATVGGGALRVDAPQDPNAVFWGAKSPNVVDLLKAGATTLSYDETFNAKELNGGSFGPDGDPDNSFNGFAQSNELAVVIAAPTGGFIQRNFAAGSAAGSDNPQWNGIDGVRHVSWDLTKFTSADGKTLAQFIAANNATDARFWLVTQGSDANGHQGPMRFYFDNFVVAGPGATNTGIGDFDGFDVSKIVKLPAIPDTDAIGFNSDNGLLYHTSGAASYSNSPTSNGFRDNQFMETVDVVSGSNATHVVYNSNSEQFGPPGPRPTWLEPQTRRTDDQTDASFNVAGPNEYHTARDLAWSEQAHAFFVADEHGIYKLTADGQSTFIGDPAFGSGGPKGIAWITLDNKRQLIVGERDGPNLHLVDPLTGQTYGDPVQVTDADLNPIPGILSLAESPDGSELLAIGKDPAAPKDAFHRFLLSVDPVTGAATKLGQFDIDMADLAFVYPVATAAAVSEVYVRGSTWTSAFKTYMAGQGLGDANLGYRVDNKAATDIAPWINLDEVVVRYSAPPTGGGIPTPGSVVLDGVRSDYTVASVTQIDPQTFALRLDRPLGNLATPPGGENGDRIKLTIAGGGAAGAAYNRTINVLQGDVDKSGSVVANDFSDVKKKFFKSTAAPGSGDTGYTVYHDVDGSGQIVANDFSEVKKRFFDNLPPAAASASSVAAASITSDLFGTKKILA